MALAESNGVGARSRRARGVGRAGRVALPSDAALPDR